MTGWAQRQAEEAEYAAEDIEALRKDAKRYRWLRNVGTVKGVIDWNALDWEFHDLPAMDSAIDAAMKDKP